MNKTNHGGVPYSPDNKHAAKGKRNLWERKQRVHQYNLQVFSISIVVLSSVLFRMYITKMES